MSKKKKQTLRSIAKYPALDPHLNLRTRIDELDFDYLDKLNDKEKQFLNNFANEYTHTVFKKGKKRLHKKKEVESEKNKLLRDLHKNLQQQIKAIVNLINSMQGYGSTKTKLKRIVTKFRLALKKQIKREMAFIKDVYKKDAYDRNNARNRCVLSRAKAQGKVLGYDDLPETFGINENVEDELIDMIDKKREN